MPLPTEWLSTIQSANFPDRIIRHRDFLAYLDPNPGYDFADGDFVIGPGLADGRLFSIQSTNFPNYYLRHQDLRLKLQQYSPGDDQFAQDATFELTPALAYAQVDKAGVSFRAYNLPGHFLRHSKFEIWLNRYEDSDLFRLDASFWVNEHSGHIG